MLVNIVLVHVVKALYRLQRSGNFRFYFVHVVSEETNFVVSM